MKARPSKRKRRIQPQKTYTFNVKCSFALQFSLNQSEVEQDSEGGEGDVCPTSKALRSLEKEFTEALGAAFSIDTIEAYADFDDLIAVEVV
jgi:hypothetical protein